MAKILIRTDDHFKTRGSMSNESRGNHVYSARLDSLVSTYKFMHELAVSRGVDILIDAGDILDKPLINEVEAQAISEAFSSRPNIPDYILVGNHDSNGATSSVTSVLSNYPGVTVVSEYMNIPGTNIALLPFTTNYDKDLSEHYGKVLISHIDLIGTMFGPGVFSTTGFDPQVLSSNFSLVLNGHLHSPSASSGFRELPNVFNIGAITGSSLGDNYNNRYPSFLLVDTDSMSLEVIHNPHSLIYLTHKCESIQEVMTKTDESLLISCAGLYLRYQVPAHLVVATREYINLQESNYPKIYGSQVTTAVKKVTAQDVEVLGETAVESMLDIQLSSDKSPQELLLEYVKSVETSLPTDLATMERLIKRDYLITSGGTD